MGGFLKCVFRTKMKQGDFWVMYRKRIEKRNLKFILHHLGLYSADERKRSTWRRKYVKLEKAGEPRSVATERLQW